MRKENTCLSCEKRLSELLDKAEAIGYGREKAIRKMEYFYGFVRNVADWSDDDAKEFALNELLQELS